MLERTEGLARVCLLIRGPASPPIRRNRLELCSCHSLGGGGRWWGVPCNISISLRRASAAWGWPVTRLLVSNNSLEMILHGRIEGRQGAHSSWARTCSVMPWACITGCMPSSHTPRAREREAVVGKPCAVHGAQDPTAGHIYYVPEPRALR